MILTHDGAVFIARCTYNERHMARARGFRWDRERKRWWTADPLAAGKLIDVADDAARAMLNGAVSKAREMRAASTAATADMDVPCRPGLAFRPFQRAAVAFALRCFENGTGCILGDEQGLGKTVEAIGVINAVPEIKRVLVVCPASLKLTWKAAIEKWAVRTMRPQLVMGSHLPVGDCLIANWDLLRIHAEAFRAQPWDLVIFDEVHQARNPKAQRTIFAFGGTFVNAEREQIKVPPLPAARLLCLSGTLIVNRPIEAFPTLRACDRKRWTSKWRYAERYCNPPEAPIWMGDLSFKPLGSVVPGDEVIGWSSGVELVPKRKHNGGAGPEKFVISQRKRLVKTRVLEVKRRVSSIVRVRLESGRSLRCTPDHLWMSGKSHPIGRQSFVPARAPHTILCHVIEPTPALPTYLSRQAAWLGGLYDGEGTWPCIAQSSAANPAVYERIGVVLSGLGFDFSYQTDNKTFYVRGGRPQAVRFLEWCQPVKRAQIEKHALSARFVTPDRVIAVEPDGFGEVISLTTETGNYIAWGFCSKNCAAFMGGWGWDTSGASHLEELHDILTSTIMVRRLKRDVLKELPPKTWQLVELAATSPAERAAVSNERTTEGRNESVLKGLRERTDAAKRGGDPAEYQQAVEALQEGGRVAFTEMAARRRETAVAKLDQCIEFIDGVLEEETKLLLFAHHLSIIDALAAHFGPGCVKLDGRDTMLQRQRAVERFQNDPSLPVFIGQIQAAGVGLTLTAADHVVFLEQEWTPGAMQQAADRVHRIGQERPVLIQNLVLEGSFDAKMAKTWVEKQGVIDLVLNPQEAARCP